MLPLLTMDPTYLHQLCTAVDQLDWLSARHLLLNMVKTISEVVAVGGHKNKLITTKVMQTAVSYFKASTVVKELGAAHVAADQEYDGVKMNDIYEELPSHIARAVVAHDSGSPNNTLPGLKFESLPLAAQKVIQDAKGKTTGAELVS